MVEKAPGRGGETAVDDVGKLQGGGLVGGEGVVFFVKLGRIGGVEGGDGEESVLCCDVGVDIVPVRT